MQFTQHPAGIIETGNIGVMQLTIPRLKKHESSSLRLTHQAIQLEHYTGRSKLNPPLLQTKALSAEESQLQSAAVRFSQQRDAAWLSQVHQNDKPVEWGAPMHNKTQWWRAPATRQRHWWCSDLWSTRQLPTPTPLWQRLCTSKWLWMPLVCSTPMSQSTSNCIILHAQSNRTTHSAGPASYFTHTWCTLSWVSWAA